MRLWTQINFPQVVVQAAFVLVVQLNLLIKFSQVANDLVQRIPIQVRPPILVLIVIVLPLTLREKNVVHLEDRPRVHQVAVAVVVVGAAVLVGIVVQERSRHTKETKETKEIKKIKKIRKIKRPENTKKAGSTLNVNIKKRTKTEEMEKEIKIKKIKRIQKLTEKQRLHFDPDPDLFHHHVPLLLLLPHLILYLLLPLY